NDNYGHIKGDRVLKKVALILQRVVKRTNDVVARFGGEEFIILLHNADKKGTKKVAEKILKEIRNERIKHDYTPAGILTVSIGCCTAIPSFSDSPDELIHKADKALYLAKKNGKNRFEVCE
ncbi:GGDEF domain-containing protein, partial [Lutibacter sp.]